MNVNDSTVEARPHIRRLLTARQLASRAGLSPERVSKLIRKGVVSPEFKAGRMSLFDADKVKELLQAIEDNRLRNWRHVN